MTKENIDTITRIRELIDRFFDGSTTCEQERELERFYASGQQLPADLEQYREMFGWYAAGMPEDELSTVKKPARRMLRWQPWVAWGAAAAVAIVMFTLAWIRFGYNNDTEQMYASSYVVRNGVVISGDDEVNGEIAAALLDMALLDMELDRQTENIDPYITDIL